MAITAAQLQVEFRATGARDVEGAIDRVDSKVKQATGGFDAFFDSIQGGAGDALRALDGISRAVGSLALMGGITLLAGGARDAWNQVDAVQQATVALRAYETDARKVDKVLSDLLRFARSDQGKLFMRQELFHAAQAMKVAGAETENLARYTEILSRSVSSGMGNWNELERVIGRVGSTSRLAGEDFEMLQKMGFQLDSSLRNATVSWEELFDALDRGSFIIEGQSQTIQGLSMTIRSAIRSIGTEFLGVNSETSMFEAGGLGAKVIEWMQAAPGEISKFASVAGQAGDAIVSVINVGENLVGFFQMLPQPVQTAVTTILKLVAAFGALRVASRAMGMIGGLMGMGGMMSGIGSLMGGGMFRGGAAGASGLASSLGLLLGRINPLGIAMTGVVAIGASWVNSFMNQKKAADDLRASVSTLEATFESLRRQGLRDRAAQGEGLAGMFSDLDERSMRYMDEWYDRLADNDRNDIYAHPDQAELERYLNFQEVSIAQQTELNSLLNQALLDPTINVDEWMNWATALLAGAENAEELQAAVDLIISTPLSDFAIESADSMDGLNDSMKKVGATASEISEIFSGLPSRLDDLRIDGLSRQANDIEQLGTAMEAAFKPIHEYQQDRFGQDTGLFTVIDELDATKLDMLSGSWERISDALASGNFDNARLIADVMTVIADDSLSMDQKADEIDRISNSLSEYLNVAAQVLEVLGRGSLTSMLDLAGLGGDAVAAAASVNELSASMDTLFRVVVGNTNAIGSQFEALFNWADELIAAEGVYSKLDDLVKNGRISGESGVFTGDSEYALAQQAYNSILEDNEAIQESILTIQAKQAPLLAANASAMEEYMRAIADMPVDEQLAALGFMDSSLQQQLGTVIDLGGQFKTLGAEGEESFRAMAQGIANTNPALFAMMEQIGLVTDVVRDNDGTVLSFDVNLDGATSVQDALNDLIESVDALTLALGGIPPVRVDTSEVDPAIEKLNALADAARNAVLAGLGNIGGGGNNSTRTGSRDAGTWGNTGVPIVTGLPETGTGGTVTVDADTSSAHQVITLLEERLNGLEARTFITTVDADTSSAHTVISLMEERVNALETRTFITTVDADTSSAHTVLGLLQDRLDAYEVATYTTALSADSSSAHTVLTLLQNRLDAFNGSVYTATMNVNVSSTRIPGRATGGYVDEPLTLVGEGGPELVSLPRGSYVHTNAQSMRMMAGSKEQGSGSAQPTNSVSVSFAGATFNNTSREEMNAWANEDFLPEIQRAAVAIKTGMGVSA